MLVLVVLLSVGAPAAAHEADPRIVTTLQQVEPALPVGVVVQVQAGIAAQLVARNPTDTVLEVLGRQGRPFLRISRSGVLADVGAEEFFSTSSPSGATPAEADDGPARWVRISAGDSWGWYDHRLHPQELAAPSDVQRPARLGEFTVPLRYGGSAVTARGEVSFAPLLGSFLVSADPAPPGLTVQALPGRLPGLFLTVEAGTPVTVKGRDGEPYLRFTDAGVEVNVRSRTHVEDRAARGQRVAPPALTPEFAMLAPGARSWTWLDSRLRYPADLPPEEVLRADGPTRIEQWEVPVELAGRGAALTGGISWVPEADAAARVGGEVTDEAANRLPYVLGALAVLVLVCAVLVVRRSARR